MLATGGGRAAIGRVVDTGGREAAQSLGQACVASNDCLRIGMGLVTTMARVDSDRLQVPSNHLPDTRTASDLGSAWSAPGGRRAVVSTHLHTSMLARL